MPKNTTQSRFDYLETQLFFTGSNLFFDLTPIHRGMTNTAIGAVCAVMLILVGVTGDAGGGCTFIDTVLMTFVA